MSYLIHDAETTIKQSFKRKANPFDTENYVVANGFKRGGPDITGESGVFTHYYGRDTTAAHIPISPTDKLLVGFNYKFDLLHHWTRPELHQFFRDGGKVWCCQYAEYLLEGQIPSAQMCSLEDLSIKYGGDVKIDEVKEMWKQGIDTPDIPEDLLIRYLHGDIENTEIVFLAQVKRAREQGQLIDIMGRMEGLLATTEMEYNGIYVNREQAAADQSLLESELRELSHVLEAALPEMPEGFTFNWGSNVHKSCLLFGGTVKYDKWKAHLDEQGNLQYAQMDELCYIAEDGRLVPVHLVEALDEKRTEDVKNVLLKNKSGKNKGVLKTKKRKIDNPDKPKGAIQPITLRLSVRQSLWMNG